MQFKTITNQPSAPVTVVNPLTTPLHCVVCFAAGADGFNFLKNAKQTTRRATARTT
jgi:hypothetical protein